MKRSVSLFTGALAALLLAGTSARAADIPWSYNWTPSTTQLNTNTTGSYLSITNEPGGNTAGNSTSVVTNLRVISNAPPVALGAPTFTSSSPVTFTLALTDTGSGMTHDFTYTVKFGGYVNSAAAAVTANFVGLTSFTTQIGSNTYTINDPSYTPPGAPGATNAGSIAVQVSVAPASVVKPQGTPEPSTLVLSCVGLSFLGLAGWRKRRQAALQLA